MESDRGNGKTPGITESSGNIFADLNLPSTPEDLLKVEIARRIAKTIEKRGLTQVKVAQILGTDQAKVSAIVRGRLKDFGADRLVNYLVALGHDVHVQISERSHNGPGKIRISA